MGARIRFPFDDRHNVMRILSKLLASLRFTSLPSASGLARLGSVMLVGGALLGAATPTTAQKLVLDGNLDYAVAPDTSTLSVTGKAFAVELWVRHDGTSGEDAMILDKLDTNNNGFQLHFVGSGEEPRLEFDHNRGQVGSNSGIPADRWTHVAVKIGRASCRERVYCEV